MTKITIDSTLLEQISKELDALKRRGVFGDFTGVADALKAAMAEPQDPDSWGAGYEAGYDAGVAEHPTELAQEPAEFAVSSNGRHSPLLTAMMNARRRAEAAQPVQEPVATVTECEACFTPDVCQLRGKCDYYAASQLRIAAPPPVADKLEQLRAFCKSSKQHTESRSNHD